MDRRAQISRLYGLEFPDVFFEFWDWVSALQPIELRALQEDLGLSLVGPFDVLAGRFDGVDLVYPALLHWRFRDDPPEFFTVISGDADGLHWGLWIDSPGEMDAIVAATYVRDAPDIWPIGNSLFDAVRFQIEIELRDIGLPGDESCDAEDLERRERLEILRRCIPPSAPSPPPSRELRCPTPEGMGIVVPLDLIDTSRLASDPIDSEHALALSRRFLADGLPGNALHLGRSLFRRDHGRACEILASAYDALGRPALAAVARAHQAQPDLPTVDILDYRRGDHHTFEDALLDPPSARRIEVGGLGLSSLPDMSAFKQLEELSLWGNALFDLPPSLSELGKLRRVNLFRNQFTTFPAILASLPNLAEVMLGRNVVTSLGESIGQCPALERLDVADNELTALPEALGELRTLRELNVANNPLQVLPESIGRVALRRLGAHGCRLKRLPTDLSGWRGLEAAYLGANPLPVDELERLRSAAPNAEIVR